MKRNIIYIGEDFYFETGTMMSCIYEKTSEGYERFDWGFMERAVRHGDTVVLRPATGEERGFFIKKKEEYLDKKKAKSTKEMK